MQGETTAELYYRIGFVSGEATVPFLLSLIHIWTPKEPYLDTLESLGVQNVKIKIVDKGALDCTIRARVEAAVYRSAGQSEQLPWGGAIR